MPVAGGAAAASYSDSLDAAKKLSKDDCPPPGMELKSQFLAAKQFHLSGRVLPLHPDPFIRYSRISKFKFYNL